MRNAAHVRTNQTDFRGLLGTLQAVIVLEIVRVDALDLVRRHNRNVYIEVDH